MNSEINFYYQEISSTLLNAHLGLDLREFKRFESCTYKKFPFIYLLKDTECNEYYMVLIPPPLEYKISLNRHKKFEYIKYAEEAIKEIQTYKSHPQNIKKHYSATYLMR